MKMSLKISKMLDRKDQMYEENEKRVLQMIDHPFIVKFLDEFMIDGKQCIIMELAEKGSLKGLIDKRIEEKKPFTD